MRTVYFHEDDYCQCEVLPLAAKEYCLREMGDIDAFAEEHKEGQFYTDIYMREDSPHTLRELALRSQQFASALEFLPAFDRVETGYSSYREECEATCARGFSNELAVFWETNEEGFVTALWLVIWVKAENADTVRRIYTALGSLAPLLLADWNLNACVDLTDTVAIEKYLQEQLHTENTI